MTNLEGDKEITTAQNTYSLTREFYIGEIVVWEEAIITQDYTTDCIVLVLDKIEYFDVNQMKKVKRYKVQTNNNEYQWVNHYELVALELLKHELAKDKQVVTSSKNRDMLEMLISFFVIVFSCSVSFLSGNIITFGITLFLLFVVFVRMFFKKY